MVQEVQKTITTKNTETSVKDNDVFRRFCAIIQDKCYNVNPYGKTTCGIDYNVINLKYNIQPEDKVYRLSGNDFITMMSLTFETESRFNIEIPDEDNEKSLYNGTVADWCNYISAKKTR